MTTKIEREGNRIHAVIPYAAGAGPVNAKRVPGARWSKSNRVWTYPLAMDSCRALRRVFGSELEIGPALWSWATAETEKESALTSIASGARADIEKIAQHAPRLAEAMGNREYQTVGAAFIAAAERVLLADQPGLGKTLQALGAVVERERPGAHLVFAPKTAITSVWAPEIERWLGDFAESTVATALVGAKAKRTEAIADFFAKVDAEPDRHHFLLANTEMVRSKKSTVCPDHANWTCDGTWEECPGAKKHKTILAHDYPDLFGREWTSVIVDESHRNGLIRTSGSMTQSRLGMMALPLADHGLKLAMTGTPMKGKPANLWGTLNWLRPDVYTSYWNWVSAFFLTDDSGYGTTVGGLNPEREGELFDSLKSIMLRRTKGEVLKDLPAKQYGGSPLDPSDPTSPIGVWLPMDGKQAKAYEDMAKHAVAQLDGGTLSATGVLAEMTRLKQFASNSGRMSGAVFQPSLPSNKFEYVMGMLEERGISGKDAEGDSKIVIVSQFTQTINLWAEEMRKDGIDVAVLTGETKDRDRVDIVKRFQEPGGPRVFFLNTMAGGVAITLDAADELVFIDETWVPDDQEQAEDRIHRASRMHQVTIYYLRSLGSIEEHIARSVGEKENAQKAFMDGRRGVEYARRLITEEIA